MALCAISKKIMIDPVYVNGEDYDRATLIKYLEKNNSKDPDGNLVTTAPQDFMTSSKRIHEMIKRAIAELQKHNLPIDMIYDDES